MKPSVVVDTIPTLVNLVLDDYVKVCSLKLGSKILETISVNSQKVEDVKSLSDEGKYAYLLALFNKSKEVFGPKVAGRDLEKSVKGVMSRFGVTKGYLDLLAVLPEGVLEEEKYTLLQKGELERKIKERTKELEEAKEELSKRISEGSIELETERNKLKLVLYNVFDGIFALDRQSKIIAFNKSMEDLTGFLESEVLGNNVDDYVKFLNADKEALTSDIYYPSLKVIEDKTVYKAENLTLKGKHNKEYHVSLVSSAIAEGGPSNVGCIVTIHDVTTQKELEVMKLDFVSIAAHELRTPLTSLRGYLTLLLEANEAKKMLSEEELVYLERCYLSSNQLFSLVENLLNVSRIERGNVQLNREIVEWSPLVSQIIQSFGSLAKERRVKLTYTPISTSTKVNVDPIMIGEVLSNLLDNAIRYTPSGGSVHVFLEPSDRFIITHVKDTGQWIPKESLPHLFTKFYRVSGVLEQGSKGTGLGLYISKEIVKLHGGEISVASELDKGSTFSFTVPKA